MLTQTSVIIGLSCLASAVIVAVWLASYTRRAMRPITPARQAEILAPPPGVEGR